MRVALDSDAQAARRVADEVVEPCDLRVVRVLVELVRDEPGEEVGEHRGARRVVRGGGDQVEAEVRLGSMEAAVQLVPQPQRAVVDDGHRWRRAALTRRLAPVLFAASMALDKKLQKEPPDGVVVDTKSNMGELDRSFVTDLGVIEVALKSAELL